MRQEERCNACGRVEGDFKPEDEIYVESMCEEQASSKSVDAHLLVDDWNRAWGLCTHCNTKLFKEILALLKRDYGFPKDAKLTICPSPKGGE